jgi:hypothetical protein
LGLTRPRDFDRSSGDRVVQQADKATGLPLVPLVDRWSAGKAPDAWLFDAPGHGPLRESNWKRSVGWMLPQRRPGCGDSGFMICGTRRRRSGWLLVLTRRWCSAC